MKSLMRSWIGDCAGPTPAAWVVIAAAACATAGPAWAGSQTPAPAPPANAPTAATVSGVTFANARGTLYAPARALGAALGVPVDWDASARTLTIGGQRVPASACRSLYDGTRLISVRDAARTLPHASLTWDPTDQTAQIAANDRTARVTAGEKHVYISIDHQHLRAFQGSLMVLDTRVSTGRPGHETPTGRFTAGPLKAPLVISHKYNDAPMPWSVQVHGDVVIHGFTSVPPHAASHGCIRVPLTGYNPAHYFYRWVDLGTPITIADGWLEPAKVAGPDRTATPAPPPRSSARMHIRTASAPAG